MASHAGCFFLIFLFGNKASVRLERRVFLKLNKSLLCWVLTEWWTD